MMHAASQAVTFLSAPGTSIASGDLQSWHRSLPPIAVSNSNAISSHGVNRESRALCSLLLDIQSSGEASHQNTTLGWGGFESLKVTEQHEEAAVTWIFCVLHVGYTSRL